MAKHKTNTTEEIKQVVAVATIDPTLRDGMIALLIVSLLINMFFLIAWIALQVTNSYDLEVSTFLFTR